MKIFRYILAILLLTVSCTPELADSPEMIVVEGWIESGSAPTVFITSSVSVNYDRKKMNDLISHVALNANVTVTHNDQTYTLLPSLKDEYLLKLCYTTDALKGEPGGIYRLQVDWKGLYAEAVTTIPQPGSIDSIAVEKHSSIDTLYLVKAHVVPHPDVRYYRFFSMDLERDDTYLASYMGTYDSRLNNDMAVVNRGNSDPIVLPDYFYHLGDSVSFKLASMDSIAYRFWSKHDENVMFSHVALLPYSSNMTGNIEGGLGYWFGYGVSTYGLRIAQ